MARYVSWEVVENVNLSMCVDDERQWLMYGQRTRAQVDHKEPRNQAISNMQRQVTVYCLNNIYFYTETSGWAYVHVHVIL